MLLAASRFNHIGTESQIGWSLPGRR